MRTPTCSIVRAAGVLLAAVMVSPAAAGEVAVVIRTYDMSGLAETDRAAAFAAAAAILEEAGLSVTRLACDQAPAGAPGDGCRTPLAPHELSVRLVRQAMDGPAKAGRHVPTAGRHLPTAGRHLPTAGRHVPEEGRTTLGYSLVETADGAGSLATVYVNRVADLAAVSAVDLPTLLGRAIAHEVGHLLLGTPAHATVGVMRAAWSPDALRGSTARDWRFTTADAELLRAGVRRRL